MAASGSRNGQSRNLRKPHGVAVYAAYFCTRILAAIALLASGFSQLTVQDVRSIGGSHAIASGPSAGAQNILLMGLESRRYGNGDILPASILAKLHAGSAADVAAGVGGNDPNTLILIHMPVGAKRLSASARPSHVRPMGQCQSS